MIPKNSIANPTTNSPQYLILPLFAFANAGIALAGVSIDGLMSHMPLGIALALFIGKPVGVFLASWLAVKSGVAKLPDGIGFKEIFGVSVFCGIGFTMSIFISSLAFIGLSPEDMAYFSTFSRLGILIGSTIAAVVGYLILNAILPKSAAVPTPEEANL